MYVDIFDVPHDYKAWLEKSSDIEVVHVTVFKDRLVVTWRFVD